MLACITLAILFFSCTPYVLTKRVNKQNGYILYTKDHHYEAYYSVISLKRNK